MRKSQTKTRRFLYAGTASVTAAAAVVVGVATPTYAVAPSVLSHTSVAPGSTITITDADNLLSGLTTLGGLIVPGSGTCPTPYAAGGATLITPIRVGDGEATVLVPATLARGLFSVCVYASTATSSNPPLMAANLTVTSAGSLQGGPASGTMTVTAPGAFTNAPLLGTYFTTSTCGGTYSTTSVVTAATTRRDADSATFTIPTGLTLNSSAAFAKAYNVCVFSSNIAGSGALLTTGAYTLAPLITLTPATGVAGGGNTITATVPSGTPIVTASTMTFAGFAPSSTGCPLAYTSIATTRQAPLTRTTTTTANTAGTATVPVGVGGPNGTTYSYCIYSAASGDTLIAASAPNAYTVTLASASLSVSQGGGGASGTVVTLASTSTSAFPLGTAPAAVFFPQSTTASACPALYTASGTNVVAAADTRRLTNTKASIQLPSGGTDMTKAKGPAFSVCVYNGIASTSKLIANSTYTVVDVPDLTAITPVSGPPAGGNSITITGIALPETMTNTTLVIGGITVPSADISAMTTTSMTVKVPAHAMGAVNVTLTTANGTDTLVGGYTYVNSLTVGPNTAPNTAPVALDIFGTNFSTDYDFDSAGALAGSHVYLVDGPYSNGGPDGTARDNARVMADCADVLVIDDSELVCTLDLTATLGATGVASAASDALRVDVPAAGAVGSNVLVGDDALTFTQADVGKSVTDADADNDIAADTTIVAVADGTTAIISSAVLADGIVNVDIGTRRDNVAAVGATDAGFLTAAAGIFTSADIGRVVTDQAVDNDITVGDGTTTFPTYITGVNGTGTVATLSQPVLTNGVANVDITSSNAVPPGAYNIVLVSNAAPQGVTTTSMVSSGSTFTVSPF